MSSAGQAAGGVLGAVGGFFLAGPLGVAAGTAALYGAQIGMTIGGYLDPPKGPKQEPPATKDLTVQTATYGALRPRLYGTIPVYANIFWLENNLISVVVKKTKQGGGKGGAKKTKVVTKTYYGTFAAGLCDCPSAPIVGVKRIWLGGKLWYDAGSADQDTIRASNDAATNFTLYIGSDAQLADDRMQATLGIANTPAYRGLAYIVFKDLPLAPYGDTLMGLQIKVEVMTSATTAVNVLNYTGLSFNQPVTGGEWFKNEFYLFEQEGNTNSYATSPTGDPGTWVYHSLPSAAFGANVSIVSAKTNKYLWLFASYQGGTWRSKDGRTWSKLTIDARQSYWGLAAYGNNLLYFHREYYADAWSSTDGGDTWRQSSNSMSTYQSVPQRGYAANATHAIISSNSWFVAPGGLKRNIQVYDFSNGSFTYMRVPDGLGLNTENGFEGVEWFPDMDVWVFITQTNVVITLSSDLTTWTARASFPSAWSVPAYADGRIWTTSNGTQYYTYDLVNWTTITNVASIVCYGFVYNDAIGLYFGQNDNAMQLKLQSITATDVTLASIVSSEVLQSKVLAAGDIDVTLLASQTVRGYKVSNVSAIRSALEPLQGAWPFDVVHRGYQIKFKPRGTNSVVTIPENDLDARSAGDTPGTALTSVREMDSVLPRRVTMQYLDYSREYDVNTQYAERLNTDAVNIQSLDLAIVLTSDEAARIVEILLYMYWMERYSLKFSLPSTYNNLEPGDVVTITASTGTYVVRLTQITYTADGLLECDAKYSRAATYISTAVGGTPPAVTVTLALGGDSIIELLDIPLLDDTMNQAGFVAAMTGYSSGWPAGQIYRTDDGGATYIELQAFTAPGSEIGYAFNSIGAGRTDIFDNASVLQVYFIQDPDLSPISELAVLNGDHYFAYGVHGRWEIIAVKTCTQQVDGSYLFSDMLRGRKGTEWACGLHAAGDTVVKLDNTSVIFVGASTSLIGLSRTYRGVTDGQTIDAASDYSFTYTGVNLECYAPVYLNGSRHPTTNDWTFTWIPRTRVGGEWRDYVDATMVEATESYTIKIYADGTYTTVKRTLTSTTPTVQYTGANQIADFGVSQSQPYLDICQVSAVVGEGYPLRGTVSAPFLTRLLMHMDDVGLTDVYGHTVTLVGGATRSAAQSLFGSGYSAYFPGGGTSRATIPHDANISMAGLTSALTIEAWVFIPSLSNTFVFAHKSGGSGVGYPNWTIVVQSDGSVNAQSFNNPSSTAIAQRVSAAGVVVASTWTHVALVKNGSQFNLFVNGVPAVASGIGNFTTSPVDSLAGVLGIGWDLTPTWNISAHVEELRISAGARYTGDFSASLQASAWIE